MFLSRNLDQNMLKTMRYLMEKSYRIAHSWCLQALAAHHHILKSFKNTLLSRDLDPNIFKMLYFWKKLEKLQPRWVLRPRTPIVFWRLPPDPRVVASITCYYSCFLKHVCSAHCRSHKFWFEGAQNGKILWRYFGDFIWLT